MLVSDRDRVAFVHVQKTGGRTVNTVLWEQFPDLAKVGARHARWSDVLELRPEMRDFYLFGFVRNPWDRMVSWYSMISTAHERGPHAKFLTKSRFWQAVRDEFTDFDDFVRNGVGDPKRRPVLFQRLRRPQTSWFEDAQGKFCADFVGRTENLDADLKEVLGGLGREIETVPRVNTSAHARYSEYYNRRTRSIIARAFADDIDRFGYRF